MLIRKENAELRAQLDIAHNREAADKRAHLQQRIETLKAIPKTLGIREQGKTSWDIKVETNLFKIFSQLAPEMMVETSTKHASEYLALMNKPEPELMVSATAPIATNHVKMLLADLASLDLVEPSKKKHPVADKDSYWSLTQEGIEVLKLDRATRLEAAAAKAMAAEEACTPPPAPPAKRAAKRSPPSAP